jgi:hypothetical protein
MRASVDPAHPFYRNDCSLYDVFCDGKKLDLCITASEEDGYAICYATGDHGMIIID